MSATPGANGGIPQPLTYPVPAEKVKHLDTILRTYDVEPSDSRLSDLAVTGLLFTINMPDTPDEEIELTSGRYDGQRFSGATGDKLPPKPIADGTP